MSFIECTSISVSYAKDTVIMSMLRKLSLATSQSK